MVRKSSQETCNPQTLLSLVIDEKSLIQRSKDGKMKEPSLKDGNNDITQNDITKDELFPNINDATE
jgi:hypothetical protein